MSTAVRASTSSQLSTAGVGASSPSLDDAIARACARIAPTWPLDRFIAVNPFWGMVGKPLAEVSAELLASAGSRLLMPRAWYREAYEQGRLREAHLEEAIRLSGSSATLGHLRALLARDEPEVARRARVLDVVDAGRDLVHEVSCRELVTNAVSQFCAAYFDEHQATLAPDRTGGLYASWRRSEAGDLVPALRLGPGAHREAVRRLPTTAREAIERGLAALDVPARDVETYLWGLLLDQNGWASWCAYRRWTARLAGAGADDDVIVDLLAIRLSWEWLLYEAGGSAVARRWQLAMASWQAVDRMALASQADDWMLQRAAELAWQEAVLRALPAGFAATRPASPAVQAVLCIDVRSEVLRRSLEATTPAVQTLGFAGFFGLPVEYLPLGAPEARSQLPGLLAPRLRVTDTGLDAAVATGRARNLDLARGWRALRAGAVSTFTFVEAMGLTYAAALLSESLGRGAPAPPAGAGLPAEVAARSRPRLTHTTDGGPIPLEARCDLAAGMLRAMSLTGGFARLVLLVGHASATRNNPHGAGLDCGACCGQSGEVNARAAAALLNDPEVRQGLAGRGLHVPETTHFLGVLHDTTTDDVTLFELDELPASRRSEVAALRVWLDAASAGARRERAPHLGLAEVEASRLDERVRGRGRDWAQVRPEWGLANNAGFIVAPREHCRHLDLEGRSFLHEYRHEDDAGYAVLEQIMTAPMVVTHWINFQYYASTVDNARYGSGNKVLHDVVGGHLGVFEGNGGDLRIGLPMQSLHDGARWVHAPLRLSVFIEAPRPAIDEVLRKHANVRALVDHGWLHLFQIAASESAVHAYRDGEWARVRGS
jgi:hypothetical protein